MKEINSELFKNKDVVIIGWPTSGKTHLSNLLDSSNHTVIHTDDYMKYGFQESLYQLINDIKNIDGKVIIEGMLGYRLLRKGVELACFFPDVVIELQISKEQLVKTYVAERPDKEIVPVFSFIKSCETILRDYHAMTNPSKPEWHKIQNNY